MEMEASLLTALLLIPFIVIGLARNLIFDTISAIFGIKQKYVKSKKVDFGLVFMIVSIEVGVVLLQLLPSLSIDIVACVTVALVCTGAIALASGARDEWDLNHNPHR